MKNIKKIYRFDHNSLFFRASFFITMIYLTFKSYFKDEKVNVFSLSN